ncbi:MAG: hypothetical protein K8T26_05795 [Lentisphaerae bacterium]|nr:hypothetical protein [Lentisphaerota bacterium]
MIDPVRMELVLPINLLIHRYPVSLVPFVTERCNAACAQCFISPERCRSAGRDLALEEIERLT